MNHLCLILLLFLTLGCELKNSPSESTSVETKQAREIDYDLMKGKRVLLKEVNDNYFHFVYIQRDTSAAAYQLMKDFNFKNYDYHNSHEKNVDTLKAFVSGNYNKKTHQFAGNWVGLKTYKNERFLYIPKNRGLINKTVISTSTITDFMMDGIYPNLITKVQESEKSTTFQLVTPGQVFINQNYAEKRKIEFFDAKKEIIKISLYQDDGSIDRTDYYIPSHRVSEYPIITTYTDNPVLSKDFEFDQFEK